MGETVMATATNLVTDDYPYSQPLNHSKTTVNPSIPTAGMETWKRQAIQKVIALGALTPNWDGYGSGAPGRGATQAAIDLLMDISGETLPTPRVIPVSGGGYHFEWTLGHRDVEISIEPDCRVEVLGVEQGVPIEDDAFRDYQVLFSWLAAR
jgi:hypothetical protein